MAAPFSQKNDSHEKKYELTIQYVAGNKHDTHQKREIIDIVHYCKDLTFLVVWMDV